MPDVGQRFNPRKKFDGIFIVNPVAQYRGLSPGAKMVWGRLYRFSGESGEIYPAVKTIASDLGMGKSQARRYLHELVEEKFLEIQNDPGHSNDYFFLWHSAFDGDIGNFRMAPLPSRPLQHATGVQDATHLQHATAPTPVASYRGPLQHATGHISTDLYSEGLSASPIVPVPEEQNRTPDLPETDACSGIEAAPPPKSPPPRETDLDTPVEKFVPVAYRQEGRSRPKDLAKSKDWLRTVEKEYGPDEFRWLLRCYLQADTPALRKAGWPLRMFLRSPTMNAIYEPTPVRIPGPAPVSGPDQDPISPQPALPTPADIVAAWNALIPEKAVSASSRPAVLKDREFVAIHADVFARVRARLDEKRPDDWWIDFGWVCGTKDGVANWNKIRSGKLSGSFTNGSAKPSAADRHRALAEKLIRASRARQAEKAPTGTGEPHPAAPAG